MKGHIKTIAIVTMLLMAAVLFSGCGNAAKLTEYDFGSDKIPSINAVIGEERKVSGVSTGAENGVVYKQYTYQTRTMVDDLMAYYSRLDELGWSVTKDFDLNDVEGEMQLAIESADEGKILIMSVAFTPNRYAVKISKMVGTLNYG